MGMEARNHAGAKCAYLIVVGAVLCGVNQEIHVEALTVGVTQDVHEPGLDAPPVHSADDVKDADGAPAIGHHEHNSLPLRLEAHRTHVR